MKYWILGLIAVVILGLLIYYFQGPGYDVELKALKQQKLQGNAV